MSVIKVDCVFAEIPVYRCHPGAHEECVQNERLKLQALPAVIVGEGSESFRSATNYFGSKVWYPWRHNELIGFIRLYVCGSQVRVNSGSEGEASGAISNDRPFTWLVTCLKENLVLANPAEVGSVQDEATCLP